MKNGILKKSLSVFLAILMIVPTLFATGAPGLLSLLDGVAPVAQAAVTEQGKVAFYVPEVIYLYPNATAWKETTSTSFQYYVENSVNTSSIYTQPTPNTALNNAGTLYFAAENGFSDVAIATRFCDASGNTISGGSVTVGSFSNKTSYGTFSVTAGTSPSLAAATTGCYLEWTVTYTNNAGERQSAIAYSYVYKPYTVPYGGAIWNRNGKDTTWFNTGKTNSAHQITWVSGVHAVSAATEKHADWAYPKFGSDRSLAAFLSSQPKAYVGATETSGSLSDIRTSTSGVTKHANAKDMYAVFSNSGYFYDMKSGSGNADCWNWFSNTSGSGTYDINSFDHYTYNSNNDDNTNSITYLRASSNGTIYIDISRYSNLAEVPNLGVGLMVTSNDSSQRGSWYVADVTDANKWGTGQYNGGENRAWFYENDTNRDGAISGVYIAGAGGESDNNMLDASALGNYEGRRYSGTWVKDIDKSVIGNKNYIVKGYYGNVDNQGDHAITHCLVNMTAVQADKSTLRTAVNNAINAMGTFGLKDNYGSYYYDTNSTAWTAFKNAYRNACIGLTKLDGSVEVSTLVTNLNNAVAALKAGQSRKIIFNVNYNDINPNYYILGTATDGGYGLSTVYNADESITLNGTISGANEFGSTAFTPAVGSYTFSSIVLSGSLSGDGCVVLDSANESNANIATRSNFDFTGNSQKTISYNNALAQETDLLRFWQWKNTQNTVYNNLTFRIKVEKGSVKTAYSPAARFAAANGTYGTLPTPDARQGYNFDGWYKEAACTNKVNAGDAVSADMLYAKWIPITYTVKFVNFAGQEVSSATYAEGTPAASVVKPATTTPSAFDSKEYHYVYTWPTVQDVTADVTYKEVQSTQAHTLTSVVTPPTCTAQGYTTYTCSVCNMSFESDYTDALSHKPGEIVVEHNKPATCTASGSYDNVQYCTVCGNEVSRVTVTVDPTGHTEAIREEIITEATCGAEGKKNIVTYCTVCNAVISSVEEAIPATGNHSYVKTEHKATCLLAGYDVFVCSVCNDEYSVDTDAPLGHNPVFVKDDPAATCTTPGTRYFECTRCSEVTTETIEALGHSMQFITGTPATCTSAGTIDHFKCSRCNGLFADKNGEAALDSIVDPIKEHTPKAAINEKIVPATCTAVGSHDEVVYCEICNNELSRTPVVDPVIAHTAADAVEEGRVESTCTVAGYYNSVVYCSVCNTKLSSTKVDLPLAAHTEEILPATDSTCTVAGKTEGKKCSVCNTILVEQTDKALAEHTPAAAVEENRVPSTCTVAGSYDSVVKCSACGYEISRNKVDLPLAEHTPGTAVEENKVDATCAKDGSYDLVTYCSVCKDVIKTESKTIPATGNHSLGDYIVDVQPTCAQPGSQHKECANCDYKTEAETIPATGAHVYATEVEGTRVPATCKSEGSVTFACACGATEEKTLEIDPSNHANLVTDAAVAATCTATGLTEGQHCAACGVVTKAQQPTDKLAHTEAIRDEIIADATCGEDGKKNVVTYCSVCSTVIKSVEETIPATGEHTYNSIVTKPTCTEQGFTTYTCSVCNDTYVDNYVNENGHSYDDGVVTTDPECEKEGVKTFTCSVCGDSYTKAVEKLGHEYGAATCNDPATCTRCGATTGEKLGHDFTVYVETVDYTCTEQGYDIYKCSRCDATENRNYTAAACRPEADYTVTTKATCETIGEKSILCSVCHKPTVTIVIDKREHVYKDNGVAKAATCKEAGVMNTICSNVETAEYAACSHESTRVIPVNPNAHTWKTEYTVDKKASCEAAGSKSYHCALCGAINEESVVEIAKREHDIVDTTVATEATCITNGVMNQKCNHAGSDEYEACTYTTTREITATGHVFGETVAANAETCETDGNEAYKPCTVCNKFFAADADTFSAAAEDNADAFVIKALNHDFAETFTVDKKASCTEAGSKSKHCSRCSEVTDVTVIPARTHTMVDTDEAKAATCLEDGVMNQKCSNGETDEYEACEFTSTRVITKLGHAEVAHEAKAATCEGIGWEAYVTCSRCDYTTYVEIPATGHKYVGKVTTEPTCTEKGVETFTCQNDATHTYTKPVDALNHIDENNDGYCDRATCNELICDHVGQETKITDAKSATCTEDGFSGDTRCAKCNVIITKGSPLPMLGHAWSSTYTSNGDGKDATHYQTCTRANCGVKNEAVAHTWNDGKVTTEPTCEGKGVMTYTCTADACGATYTEEIEANGHKYVGVTTDPTCEAEGYTTYTCSVCSDSYVADKVPATGHKYVGAVTKDPTCEGKGEMTYTCQNDSSHTYKEEIAANGHNYGEWISEIPATCMAEGTLGHYTCSVCSVNFDADKNVLADLTIAIDDDAHAWGNWSVTTVPGCHQMGIETRICAHNADHTDTQKTGYDANNHINTENHDAVTETCTTVGYTAGVYCTDCAVYISGHEEIAMIGHKNKVHHEKVDATCVAEGTIEYWSCPDCNKNFSDEACTTEVTELTIGIDTNNHDLKTTAAKAPTCTEIGWDEYVTCQREGCSYNTYNELPENGHAYDLTTGVAAEAGKHTVTCPNCTEGTEDHTAVVECTYGEGVVTEPTCTKNGYTTHTCTACGYFYTDTETEAKGHTFGKWTAIGNDKHERTCTVCADEEGRVETADCTYGEWTETDAPDCVNKGEKAHTCSVCNNTVTAEVEALGHDWADADCNKPSTCKRCGETSGDAIGHDFTVFVETVDYTCTTNGYTTYKCSRCDATENRDIIPAAHREAADYKVIEKASCDKDGYKAILCTKCGEELKTETIAKREHNLVDTTVALAPTCSATGIMNQKCNCAETAEYAACDYTTTRVMDKVADAHKAEADYTVIVKASCDADGYKAILCEYCDAELETKTIAKRAHNLVDTTVALEPTCSATGIMNQKCNCAETAEYAACDYTTTRVLDKVADAHKWETEYTVDKKASCYEAGSKSYHCALCDASNTASVVEIAKREHNIVDTTVALAPTCSATGIMNQKCDCAETAEYAACDYTTTRVMDKVADAHKAEADYTVIAKATCEADGYKAILCEYCDAELSKETIAKREHNLVDTTVALAPTCSATGIMNQKCDCAETAEYKACDYTTTRVMDKVADAHKAEADYTVIKKATCEADGYKAILCEYCDAELNKETIAKREHNLVDTTVALEPTCSATGIMNQKCDCAETAEYAACDYTTTRVMDKVADAHKAEAEYTVIVKATCEADGYKAILCEYCDTECSARVTIDAFGHDYKLDNIVRPAKQADGTWGNGYETYVCQNDAKHVETKPVERADYEAYDAIVSELTERLNAKTLDSGVRAEIEALLADNAIAQNLITSEQTAVDAAAGALEGNSASYFTTYTVTFIGKDGVELARETVYYGCAATAPDATVEGFVFTGWNGAYTNVKEDTTVTATYREGDIVVDVNKSALKVAVGSTKQIAVSILPEDAQVELTWTSADPAVATVDANGVVTGVKVGTTNVTVTALNGEVKETIAVYVYNANETYTVQLLKSSYGDFVVGGYTFNETAFFSVKSGQEFKFQFALNSKYNAEDMVVFVNGQELSLGEDNYFTIPCMTDNLMIMVMNAPGGSTGDDNGDGGNHGSNTTSHSCWCHSSNKLLRLLWKILMVICKLFGIESYHYCACGDAHW